MQVKTWMAQKNTNRLSIVYLGHKFYFPCLRHYRLSTRFGLATRRKLPLADAENKVLKLTLHRLALLVQIAHPAFRTVFKAAAFWSLVAEFGTLVKFLVVAVFEAPTWNPTRYPTWDPAWDPIRGPPTRDIKEETFRAPTISWEEGFDILYPQNLKLG